MRGKRPSSPWLVDLVPIDLRTLVGRRVAERGVAKGLGRAIARICALALELDEVDFHELVPRGTGGPFYGSVEGLMAQLGRSITEAHCYDK